MKLETTPQDISVKGDFETSSYNVGDVAFIVDMFADKVYTYKERAVVRELACNAYDSHVIAGTKDVKFKIHLPTMLEPWFSLRDFGTGLDDKEIRSIFAGIGISTKRDNNDTIGCFGIGSLSPYSLCDSFTVKSWKHGKLRTYSCYRDEDRTPVVALLHEQDSDAPNGLEVSLNIEGRVSQFRDEAVNVFKWWAETPDINDKDIVARVDAERKEYDFVGEGYALNSSWGSLTAVMGNVAYRIPSELDTLNCEGVLYFDLGEISFDTARENLTIDDKTIAAVEAKIEYVRENVEAEAVKQIDQKGTLFKQAVAADLLRRGQLGRLIGHAGLKDYNLPAATEDFTYWKRRSYYKTAERTYVKNLPITGNCEYYLAKDRMLTRIKYYLQEVAPSDLTMVILTAEQADEVCLDLDLLKSLDDLPVVPKKTHTASGKGSTVKTFVFNPDYRGWEKDSHYMETEIEDKGQEMVYVQINRWEPADTDVNCHIISGTNGNIRSSIETLKEVGVDVPEVLGLKTAFTKTAAFKTGNFISFSDYAKRELAKVAPSTYFEYDRDEAEIIKKLAAIAESDELTEFTELVEGSINNKVAKICKRIGMVTNATVDNSIQKWMDDFFEKYEMLSFVDSWVISRSKSKIARYLGATVK